MINAAAMFLTLWLVWLALTGRWTAQDNLLIAAGAALACVLIALRFVGASNSAYARGIAMVVFAIGRTGAVMKGALSTLRRAVAADVTLRPALARIRTRPSSDLAQAAFADLISATPGQVVVEADSEGMLVHVIEEDAIDAAALTALESRVIGAMDGKAPA